MNMSDLGNTFKKVRMESAKLIFVLVITFPEAEEAWMMGPKAELERRLLCLSKDMEIRSGGN